MAEVELIGRRNLESGCTRHVLSLDIRLSSRSSPFVRRFSGGLRGEIVARTPLPPCSVRVLGAPSLVLGGYLGATGCVFLSTLRTSKADHHACT